MKGFGLSISALMDHDLMNEDDVKEWKKAIQSFINKDNLADTLEDFKNGYIDELERNAKILAAVCNSYNELLVKWEELHGYIPKKIRRLEKCAWLNDQTRQRNRRR